MTITETEIQIALGTYLPEIWKQRCKLRDEGDKLRAEGYKLRAEGYKLRAEGDKLIAEGDLLFINAVIEVYGKDTEIEWTSYGYKVKDVEYYDYTN